MEREPHLPPVSDQRTLFLVNTFVIHTVRLLNNFAVICEDKLADVHRRIIRADANLSLLETKLRSVDGVEAIGEQIALDLQPDYALRPGTPQSSEPDQPSMSHVPPPLSLVRGTSAAPLEVSRATSISLDPASDQPRVLKAKDDPKYSRFFKMLQVGVPLPAVKLQMSLEGIDGSVLDDPEDS